MRAIVEQLNVNTTVRFIVTGCGAAILFYGLTYGLLRAGIGPSAAVIVGYTITVAVSYTVQHAWTFGGAHDHACSLPRYLLAQAVSASLTSLAAHGLAEWTVPPAILSGGTTLLGSGISYTLSRYWVFASREEARLKFP